MEEILFEKILPNWRFPEGKIAEITTEISDVYPDLVRVVFEREGHKTGKTVLLMNETGLFLGDRKIQLGDQVVFNRFWKTKVREIR